MLILLHLISVTVSFGYTTNDHTCMDVEVYETLAIAGPPETPVIPDTSVCAGSDVTIDFPIDDGATITETILFEDFEDEEVLYTVSTPEFTDGGQDYFIRTDGSNISSENFSNIQGSSYFAAQDIDGDGANRNQTLTFSNILSLIHISEPTRPY